MGTALPRLLLVDDDSRLLRTLSRVLSASYSIATADNGEAALEMLGHDSFDLIVSDWKMPGAVDGHELLLAFDQRHPGIPFIVMTGETAREPVHLAIGLAQGLVEKPVSIEELLSVAERCLARQARGRESGSVERKGQLTLDVAAHGVRVGSGPLIHLSATELTVFQLLWRRAGEVVTKNELAEVALGCAPFISEQGDQVTQRYAHGLRSKIEPDPAAPLYLVTVWRKGLRLIVDAENADG